MIIDLHFIDVRTRYLKFNIVRLKRLISDAWKKKLKYQNKVRNLRANMNQIPKGFAIYSIVLLIYTS